MHADRETSWTEFVAEMADEAACLNRPSKLTGFERQNWTTGTSEITP